ncbi:MAG: hypothetical protein P8184_13990, partial [Calditrichia bacterium]
QIISTPFAGPDLFTLMPRGFYGLAFSFEPFKLTRFTNQHLQLFFSRITLYQSRFANYYTHGNRYTSERTNGFYTIGLRYRTKMAENIINFQGWFYDFYDFATLLYLEAGILHGHTSSIRPALDVQFINEGNSGQQRLGPVNVKIYGARGGILFPRGSLYLVWNGSPKHYNTFRHGGMIHPYNDLSETFFTDGMNDGMGDIGPGYAYGIQGSYNFMNNRIGIFLHYVRYRADYGYGGAAYAINGEFGFPEGEPVLNQWQYELDGGISYHFAGMLHGLRVHLHIGVRDFTDSPNGAFVDNRLAFIYKF